MAGKRLSVKAKKVGIAILNLSILLFLFLPLVFVLAMAFDPRRYVAWFPPVGFTLHWFDVFLHDSDFEIGLRSSIIISTAVTVASLLIAIPCAFALARHDFRGKEFLNTLILSPIIIPGIVTGTALLVLFYSYLHIYAAMPGLIVGQTILGIPYVVRTVTASMVGFDRSLEEAAKNLGADEMQTITKVTIPIIKPGIVAGAIFAFSTSWADLSVAAFLTDTNTFTFPVAMMNYMRYNFDNTLAAASLFLVIVTALIVLVTEKTVGLDKFIGLW
jgi:putative spermidine/putrescine transport system permease protein